ncbi:MAG: T9SS type A sorting domain-containing protein [Bacteroidota bacterium]
MITLHAFLLLSFFFIARQAQAQCPFDPSITGDLLLCPGDSTVLSTQVYENYQWLKRPFGSNMATPIPGATGQTLTVTEEEIPAWFSVTATLDNCTETSLEVLVDGLVFLLPTVMHTGEFTTDPNTGASIVCEGDTMFLTLQLPYDTLITWFKNGVAIPGENDPVLAVTQAGSYTVEGAPTECPNFLLPLGVTIEVFIDEDCATGILPEPDEQLVRVFPNPVRDVLEIENGSGKAIQKVELIDLAGRVVFSEKPAGSSALALPLDHLAAGIYWLRIDLDGEFLMKKIAVQK